MLLLHLLTGAFVGYLFPIYYSIGVPLFVLILMWVLTYRSEFGMVPAILCYYWLPAYILGASIINFIVFLF